MARVESDTEVWRMVQSRYLMAQNPDIRKQGFTWIVIFDCGILGEKREMHIKNDGRVVYDRRVD